MSTLVCDVERREDVQEIRTRQHCCKGEVEGGKGGMERPWALSRV